MNRVNAEMNFRNGGSVDQEKGNAIILSGRLARRSIHCSPRAFG